MNNKNKSLCLLAISLAVVWGFIDTSSGGENIWTHSSEGMNGGRIRRVAISPNFVNDKTIFAVAGTGSTFDAFYANGIFKSTDGGLTWTWVFKDIPVPVRDIVLSPNYAADQTIFVITNYFGGTLSGIILKSVDGGINWEYIELSSTNTGTNNFGTLSAITFSPAYSDDQTVFVADWIGNIFKSTDGGVSYQTVRPTTTAIQSFAISPNYEDDQTLFVFEGHVLKSTDGGESWSTSLPLYRQFSGSLGISPEFASDSTIFLGSYDKGVYKSIDAGSSWSQVNEGLPYEVGVNAGSIRALVVSPNFGNDQTIFVVTDSSGVFKSTNGGTFWEKVEIPALNSYSNLTKTSLPKKSNQEEFGFGDSTARSRNYWSESKAKMLLREANIQGNNEASIYDLAISPDYPNDQTIVLCHNQGLLKSEDDGASWNPAMNGITAIVATDLEISPDLGTDSTLFAGTWEGLYKSKDGGQSWVLIGFKGQAVNIELSPAFATDQTLFALVGDSLFKSINAGESWAFVSIGMSGILVISPDYPNDHTLFAYWEGTGVYKSPDDGLTWNDMNNGLTSLEVSALAVSPNYVNDQTVFAGTFFSGSDGGVFRSDDGGGSW
ncbi:MAG: WD40/YVTN/BNR-like repeat-containing protein, partial [bacterium]